MSQENVEVVRRCYEELPHAQERLSDFIASYWEPDGDYYPVRKFPESRPCHGHGEIVAFLTDYLTACESYEYESVAVTAIGEDRVLVHGRIATTGRESSMALEGDLYISSWLRHGRFIRVEDHLTEKGALYALGMSGDPAPEGTREH